MKQNPKTLGKEPPLENPSAPFSPPLLLPENFYPAHRNSLSTITMSQSLELLLIQFLMPDNDARRQAEEQIKRLAKDPQVVPALIQHLRTAKTPNVRQLAAVLLRKKITGHWAKLSSQQKLLVKQSLIESITMEHRSSRLSILSCEFWILFGIWSLSLSHYYAVEWDECLKWVQMIRCKGNWVCSNSWNYVFGLFLALVSFYYWIFFYHHLVEGI